MSKPEPTPDEPRIPGLSTVHDAVQDASFAKIGMEMKATTVRVPINTLERVDQILHLHGVNFSEWVRACCFRLERDYDELTKPLR